MAGRRPTWPGVGRLSSEERGQASAAGRRCQVRGAGEPRGAEGCGLGLSPFLLLPLAASLLHFKEHPREGVPGRRAAQWQLRGAAAFIAVRQTGRNSHFPPGCSPLPPPAGRPGAHFNPLRASGARPGRPSCLLTAAAATSREAAFPGPEHGTACPGVQTECPLARGHGGGWRRPSRAPGLVRRISASRGGPVSATPQNGVWGV